MSEEETLGGAVASTARGFDDTVAGVRARFIGAERLAKRERVMSGEREVVEKKSIIGEPDETALTNQVTRDEYETAFTTLGAVDPVYDPEMLALLFEHSNSLRQNVDSYATNIDGFGHRFDPIFDLDSPDIDQRIGDAIYTDRQRALDEAEDPQEAAYPTVDEITKRKEEITRRMRIEKVKLHHFFEFCSPDTSFVTLRRRTRQDLEVTGNAYWEVLRNAGGQVVQFVYMPSFTMRLLPLDRELVTVTRSIRVSELSYDKITTRVRMRRYVQVVEGQAVFFKEFGDPRIISSRSGVAYVSLEALEAGEPNVPAANELFHFRIFSPRSAYGVPRWVGNLLAVIGSRQAEEVNFNYFENKSVPPLAILVSGGRMTENAVTNLTNYVEANLKGKRNFHKILVVEAEPIGGADANAANAARMRIDIKPLTSAQQSDAQFQQYDERNIDKVGQSFRLPRMLRGDVRDFNKSTAESALTFAEMQVFEPERQEFDFVVNRKILAELGVKFWKFVSLAPVMRDPVAMSEILKNLANAGVLTPAEGRELAGDVFNRAFRKLKAAWTKQPIQLTVAGIPPEDEPAPGEPNAPKNPTSDPDWEREGGDAPANPAAEGIQARAPMLKRRVRKDVQRLIAIRDALRASESSEWTAYLERLAHASEQSAAQ